MIWERKDLNGFQTMRSEHKVQMNTKRTNDTQRDETVGFTVSWRKPVIAPNLCKWKDKMWKSAPIKMVSKKRYWKFSKRMFKNVLFKICLYCLCIIMALKATYSQSHRSVLYLTTATAAHRVERIPICSFTIRSCFNAAHASWWMIFIFISLHSNKLYFLDTLSYY